MTSKLKYHKNYTEFGEPYQLVLPLNLEGLVPDDDSVRLLSHELEDLDYSLLYQAYSAKGRNPAVDPKTMFKILTYAYSQTIYSSRKIETACKRDINFMWLLAGQKAPDHSTIARFRSGFLEEACEDLFYQMVHRLERVGELSKETVFLDGTKLEACANKYTFVWKKSVGKWEENMKVKKATAICGRRGSSHTLNLRPMKNGKSGVLNRISVNGKTWLITRSPIPISVMLERNCG